MKVLGKFTQIFQAPIFFTSKSLHGQETLSNYVDTMQRKYIFFLPIFPGRPFPLQETTVEVPHS